MLYYLTRTPMSVEGTCCLSLSSIVLLTLTVLIGLLFRSVERTLNSDCDPDRRVDISCYCYSLFKVAKLSWGSFRLAPKRLLLRCFETELGRPSCNWFCISLIR